MPSRHDIDRATAKSLVDAFDPTRAKSLQAGDSFTFDVDKIHAIINNPSPKCISVRIYIAQNPTDATEIPTMVLVGVDAQNRELTANVAEYGIYKNIAAALI